MTLNTMPPEIFPAGEPEQDRPGARGAAMRRVIVTGAPGVGKTTLLDALRRRGHAVVGDHAREVIRERLAQGLPPRPEPRAFAEEILRRDLVGYRLATGAPQGICFFDRGIPDALGLLAACDARPADELARLLEDHPYERRVYLLPPWEAIHVTDAERDHGYAHAVHVHRLTVEWYQRCGYEWVEVPRAPVDERCAFVLEDLDALRKASHEGRTGLRPGMDSTACGGRLVP